MAALYEACKVGDIALIKELLEQGVDPNEPSDRELGDNALHAAARGKNVDIVALLLAHGADPLLCDLYGWTALHDATHPLSVSVAQLLLDRGALINAQTSEGKTPLWYAAWNVISPLVQLLLDRGADVNIADVKGDTPLHVSSPANAPLLLARGANPNAQNAKLESPLHQEQMNITKAQALLDHGADPNIRDNQGRSPLHTAVQSYFGYTPLLLRYGADPQVRDIAGRTPLHDAAESSYFLVMREMIESGADPDACDAAGRTPLYCLIHSNSRRKNRKAMSLLLYWSRTILPIPDDKPIYQQCLAEQQRYQRTRRYDHYYPLIQLCDRAKARAIPILYLLYAYRQSSLAVLPMEMLVEIIKWL